MHITQYALLLVLASFGSAVHLHDDIHPTAEQSFTKMDTNKDGIVSPEELSKYMLDTFGLTITPEKADEEIKDKDTNHDGKFTRADLA